jgi:CBS domain-containing protein
VKLVELLTLERVVVPLVAADLREASEQLTNALVASGAAVDEEKLRELIIAEIPSQVVTIGDAFLLHLRTDAVQTLVAALGITPAPIPRHDDSTKTARIVIVIVGPPKETSAYLQALSAFARLLGRQEVAEAITSAGSPAAVLETGPLADIELPGYLTVRDVMVPRTLSVHPDTPLGRASRLMVAHNVSSLPVVSDTHELLGIVSHREVLRYLLPMYVKRISSGAFAPPPRGASGVEDPHDLPVREVMDRSVLSVSEDQTLAEVATLMVNKNLDRFPVVREGALIGFLTREDVVRRIFGR